MKIKALKELSPSSGGMTQGKGVTQVELYITGSPMTKDCFVRSWRGGPPLTWAGLDQRGGDGIHRRGAEGAKTRVQVDWLTAVQAASEAMGEHVRELVTHSGDSIRDRDELTAKAGIANIGLLSDALPGVRAARQ